MANSNIPIFAFGKYEDIASALERGVLKYPSYIVCTDDNTFAVIDKDSNVRRIKGYQQENIIHVDALPTENIRTDVIYIYQGTGYLYMNGTPVPVFNQSGESVASYDDLANVPIVNQYGVVDNPIILADLDNGVYSVAGQYQIGYTDTTVNVTSNKTIVIIDSDDNNKYITKLGAYDVKVYTMNLTTGQVTTDEYVKQSWIQAQGYATESYMDQAVQDWYSEAIKDIVIPTKLSELTNDVGFLTADDFAGISNSDITGLFDISN